MFYSIFYLLRIYKKNYALLCFTFSIGDLQDNHYHIQFLISYIGSELFSIDKS